MNSLTLFENGSSLFYNTSARHERHECDTNDTSATRVRLQRHKCETTTRVLHKPHECYTNDTSATRVKIFDFDNDKVENIFSQPYSSYTANERLQGEKQFHSKNYLLEMPRPHAKMRLKSAPYYKLCNGKSYIKKLYTRL